MPTSYQTKALTGWEGLAVSILARAVMDARSHGGYRTEARYFLRSTGCRELLDNLLLALGLQNELAADELIEQLWRQE